MPVNSLRCARNDSRIILFNRFRPTASRQFFFETASPSRPCLVSFDLYKTVKYLSLLRRAPLKTRPYESLSNKRFWRENLLSDAPLNRVLSCSVAVTRCYYGAMPDYGASCARPFARRRFRTRRPAFVAIRARNPWVRARLSLLGWNVRFIALILCMRMRR